MNQGRIGREDRTVFRPKDDDSFISSLPSKDLLKQTAPYLLIGLPHEIGPFPIFVTSTSLCLGHPDHSTVEISKVATKPSAQTILGHNDLKYSIDLNWAKVTPIINASAIAESKEGELYLVTAPPKECLQRL